MLTSKIYFGTSEKLEAENDVFDECATLKTAPKVSARSSGHADSLALAHTCELRASLAAVKVSDRVHTRERTCVAAGSCRYVCPNAPSTPSKRYFSKIGR